AALFHDEELSRFFERSAALQSEIRYVHNDIACVEMACLDILAIKKSPSLAMILSKLDEVKTTFAGPAKSGVQERATGAKAVPLNQPKQSHPAGADSHPSVALNVEENQNENMGREETAPLPDDAELSSSPDLSEYDTEHPVVEKIKEIFHGEVVSKGEK
ncbi:MAG TPA: hypothetical protein VF857_04185, partial [Spirochaetota bacterium]